MWRVAGVGPGSSLRCEDVAVPRSPVTCAVCQQLRVRGSFSEAGDAFICAGCQADAKQLIEIQDIIRAEAADPSESGDGTHKAVGRSAS